MSAVLDSIDEQFEEEVNDFTPDRPMSPSSAKAILEDAELWKWKKENPQPETKATAFGSALHCMLLEPDLFEQNFYVPKTGPVNPKTNKCYGRTTQKYKEWLEIVEPLAGGKTLVMPEEYEELKIIQKKYKGVVDAIVSVGRKKYPDAQIEHERPVNWTDSVTKQPCKGFIDTMCGNAIIDLKTTGDISDRALKSKINYEYHIQAAAYADAIRQIDGVEKPKVYFLFLYSKPPYIIRPYEVDDIILEKGLDEFRRAIKVYRKWAEAGFPAVYRGIEQVSMVPYRIREIDAANGRG